MWRIHKKVWVIYVTIALANGCARARPIIFGKENGFTILLETNSKANPSYWALAQTSHMFTGWSGPRELWFGGAMTACQCHWTAMVLSLTHHNGTDQLTQHATWLSAKRTPANAKHRQDSFKERQQLYFLLRRVMSGVNIQLLHTYEFWCEYWSFCMLMRYGFTWSTMA